jgi:polar amino acid transport system permease protein
MSLSGPQQVAISEGLRMKTPEVIVAEMRAARARQSRRFRLVFGLTWAVVIGLLVGSLVAAGKIDATFLAKWGPYIVGGIPITIVVSIFSITLAVVFAVLGALGRLSARAAIYALATLYVSLVRGTPLIVQILFIYLALPQIIPGSAGIPAIMLAVFALAFNYGAYMTEIFRAGIQAIPRGQIEAAGALGMTESQTMRRVILPQAVRIVIPAIGNEFIAMIKDSALVSIIGVQELLWRAQRVGQSNFRSLETLLLAALVYWILTIAFSVVQDRLEKRMAESDRRI